MSKDVVVTIELGHHAKVLHQTTSEGFTHDWEVFVRGGKGVKLELFVEKVVFYLHESFVKPKRVVKTSPYHVKERGYGGFNLAIEIHFKSDKPRVEKFLYDLFLQRVDSPPISKTIEERVVFYRPSEEVRKRLLLGGGTEISAQEDVNHLGDKSSASRPSSGAKTKPAFSHSSGSSEQQAKKQKVETKKEVKSKEADPFSAFFGEIIKTGPDQKKAVERNTKEEKKKESEKIQASSKCAEKKVISSTRGDKKGSSSSRHSKEPSKDKENKPVEKDEHPKHSKEKKKHKKDKVEKEKKVKEKEKDKKALSPAALKADSYSSKKKQDGKASPDKPKESKHDKSKDKPKNEYRKKDDIHKKDLEKSSSSKEDRKSYHKEEKLVSKQKDVAKVPKEFHKSDKDKKSHETSAPGPYSKPSTHRSRLKQQTVLQSSPEANQHKSHSRSPLVQKSPSPSPSSASSLPSSSSSVSSVSPVSQGRNSPQKPRTSLPSQSSSNASLSRSPSPTKSDLRSLSSSKSPSRSTSSLSTASSSSSLSVPSPVQQRFPAKSPQRSRGRPAKTKSGAKAHPPKSGEESKLKPLTKLMNSVSSSSDDEDTKPAKVMPSLPRSSLLSSDHDSSDVEEEVEVPANTKAGKDSSKGKSRQKAASVNGSTREESEAGEKAAFSEEYIRELFDLQYKIMTLTDRHKVQEVVNIIGETSKFSLTSDLDEFEFDLCTFDVKTIKKLQRCFT